MQKLFILALVASSIWILGNPINAPAQEPLVPIAVKPTTPTFGPWSKPAVLRSSDDAAKLFDKDALAALQKKVDFKKQIVLVFAWKGSGGDKLTYTIAESFPEQIMFSRKPGLTRDLRQHVQVFALRSNVKWSVRVAPGLKREGGEQPAGVRQLKFKPADPTIAFKIGGQNKLTTFDNVAAIQALIGEASVKQLTDNVDFAKEQLVLVSWSTSGPPEGKLTHEIKGEDKNRKITFYVQGPGANVRGQRLRIAADFFIAPRGVAVAFDAKER